jgi:hypothetical protein
MAEQRPRYGEGGDRQAYAGTQLVSDSFAGTSGALPRAVDRISFGRWTNQRES